MAHPRGTRVSFKPLGDRAVRVDFPGTGGKEISSLMRSWCFSLTNARIAGVIESVACYDSACVSYDPLVIRSGPLCDALFALGFGGDAGTAPSHLLVIPVLYGGEAGPDLPAVARHARMTEAEVVQRHCAPVYSVVMIGFAPGFPYLAGLDPALAVPRLDRPRTLVSAGSVGIGGGQTGVYPLPSPGGWNIIGRTTLALFDPSRQPAALLAPGDEVRFQAVSGALRVDLNCDMGEGFASDQELLGLVTSANIACGGHAGDHDSMARGVEAALRAGVAVGAHPSLVDREGFGRRRLSVEPPRLEDQVAGQVRELDDVARSLGGQLSHVKLHGALYSMAASHAGIARAVLRALRRSTTCRTLFALSGSQLVELARAEGFLVAEEAFADRGYGADGALTPRGAPGAMVRDPAVAAARALQMLREGTVTATDGSLVPVRADTVCIHGDEPGAVACARALRAAFSAAGVDVKRFGAP